MPRAGWYAGNYKQSRDAHIPRGSIQKVVITKLGDRGDVKGMRDISKGIPTSLCYVTYKALYT